MPRRTQLFNGIQWIVALQSLSSLFVRRPMSLGSDRHSMVIEQLAERGIRDSRVLTAMERVPRERFVGAGQEDQAYADRALSIECGQTISQPYIVGLMTEALQLVGAEKVLEIGTGSGYQTAVLAELAAHVVTIERHRELSQRAEAMLTELGYRNVTFIVGDGSDGWPTLAPYDRIIVTAAAADVPPPFVEQLAEGGVLVIPLGDKEGQVLESLRKVNGRMQSTALSGCRFVPLVGQFEP
jgi:protein-L-isoaspartate(D-aspartate) O-methyltransferase